MKTALLSTPIDVTRLYSDGIYIVSPIVTIGVGTFKFPENFHSFPSVLRFNLRDIIQGPNLVYRKE